MFKEQKNSKIILRPTFINTLYQILQYKSADDAYKYLRQLFVLFCADLCRRLLNGFCLPNKMVDEHLSCNGK